MLIPHAKACSTIQIKTGDWKAFMPEVTAEKCIKCGICQNFCPEGIMGKVGLVPDIDYDYCKGCSICANECPVKCIEMKRVED